MAFDEPTLKSLLKDAEERYDSIIDGYGDSYSQGRKAELKFIIDNIKTRLLISAGWKYTFTKPVQWFHKDDLLENYYTLEKAYSIFKSKQEIKNGLAD